MGIDNTHDHLTLLYLIFVSTLPLLLILKMLKTQKTFNFQLLRKLYGLITNRVGTLKGTNVQISTIKQIQGSNTEKLTSFKKSKYGLAIPMIIHAPILSNFFDISP